MNNNLVKITVGSKTIESGVGLPTHSSLLGAEYTNIVTGVIYINKDGATQWEVLLDGLNYKPILNLTYLNLSGGSMSGSVIPVDSLYNLGGPTNSWSTLYVDNIIASNSSTLSFLFVDDESNFYDDVNITGQTVMTGSLTATTVSATTFYGDGSNLTGISGGTGGLSGVTNIGNATEIFSGIIDSDIKLRTLSGNTPSYKIITAVSGDTVVLDIDEPKMTLWPLVVKGNTLISGGSTFLSGLTFNISNLEYIIDETIYTATTSSVTLNSGDTTYDRFDVLVADISGNTGVVEGTPSVNPVKPQIDLDTQVEITFVSVNAGETTPVIDSTKVYDEDLGVGGGEWDFSTTASTISGDSTSQSFSGAKSIEFTDALVDDYFILDATTDYDISDDNILTFYIKNKIKWPNRYYVNLSLLDDNDIINGNTVKLDNNRYGFSHSNITSWQVVSIPLGDFGMNSNILQKIRFDVKQVNTNNNGLNLFIDLIRFQAGAPTTSPQSIWLSFIGDDGNIAVATNNTEQLRLSGGTNISTEIPSNNVAVFNLDDDINLNSVSATTISATTFYSNEVRLSNDLILDGGSDSIFRMIGTATESSPRFKIYAGSSTEISANGLVRLYTDSTFLIQAPSAAKTSAIFDPDGAVTFKHNNNTRFVTTTTGINLIGNIVVDDSLSATTISATTFHGDGSNLTGIDTVEGGSLDDDGILSFSSLTQEKFTIDLNTLVLPVYIHVNNQSGSQIDKGTVVYINGVHANGKPTIGLADNSSSSTMPAIGIVEGDIIDGEEGHVVTNGEILKINTSSFSENDTVYVSSGGTLTSTKPTGTLLIQNLGVVSRVHASNGSILINGSGRSNDLPNIAQDFVWIGDVNGVPQAVNKSTIGGGEVNTASNIGGGIGLFSGKSGTDLEFKTLTSTGGTVVISNTESTVNLESSGGGGSGVSNDNKIFNWFMNIT